MKNLFLLPLFTILLALCSFTSTTKTYFGDEHLGKVDTAGSVFYIIRSVPDSSLTKKESEFSFAFYYGYAGPVNAQVQYSCNGKAQLLKCDTKGKASVKTLPGQYKFQFFVNENYYEIYTDSIAIKPGYRTDVEVRFQYAWNNVISDKPVIYVYPQDKQQTSIHLNITGELGFTYPKYNNGWNFIADPDGTIHMNDKEYHYLFWDGLMGINNSTTKWEEGFIVERDSLVPFFEEKLKLMGLNSKETEDYITYWCPRMVANEKNYIHFMFNEEYNKYADLEVNPAPDKLFRVFMLWSKAQETNTQVIPQAIQSFERSGFTVVEWGGAEMKEVPAKFNSHVSN